MYRETVIPYIVKSKLFRDFMLMMKTPIRDVLEMYVQPLSRLVWGKTGCVSISLINQYSFPTVIDFHIIFQKDFVCLLISRLLHNVFDDLQRFHRSIVS